jgi:2-methylisocitrate lyase-like PEP mutase family enzyme
MQNESPTTDTQQTAARLCSKYIIKKYIDLGVRFVVKGNVFAKWMQEDIEQAINDAYQQGVKDGGQL